MIYLASRYSHPDPLVREGRFDAACRAAAGLIRTGRPVIAPTVQGHSLFRYGVRGDWAFWEPFARDYLRRCDEVVVLTLDGWGDSEGVQAELALAKALGKRVGYLHAEDYQ
jgi:hypothetical protein